MTHERPYSYWYSAGAIVLLSVAVTLLIFRETVAFTLHTWRTSETYSYGYLILPIVAYVLWDRRRRLHAVQLRPSWPALGLLGISCLLWLAANIADIRIGQQLALVCALNSLILLVLGWRAARTLAAPMLILFFTVPAGDGLVPRLQDLTAAVATWLLNLTRVPAVLEGRLITVPGMRWQVAEACSGARYLLSSAILGVVFAVLFYRSWKRRLILIAASIVVPIVANCVRAYGIILIGYLSNNELAHGIDHVIYGWIFFVVCMLAVFAIASRHAEPPTEPEPIVPDSRFRSASLLYLAFAAVVACIVMALPVSVSAYLNRRDAQRQVVPIGSSPRTNDNWHMTAEFPVRWISPSLDPFAGVPGAFEPNPRRADRTVYAFVGSSASTGRVLDSGERLLNLNAWTLLDEREKSISINGHSTVVKELRTQGPTGKRLIWLWCMVDGTVAHTELEVKLLQGKATLQNRPDSVTLVGVAADYEFDAKEAVPALTNFVDDATPLVTGSAGTR